MDCLGLYEIIVVVPAGLFYEGAVYLGILARGQILLQYSRPG